MGKVICLSAQTSKLGFLGILMMYLWALHRGWTDGVLHHRASGHGRFPPISSSVMLFPWLWVSYGTGLGEGSLPDEAMSGWVRLTAKWRILDGDVLKSINNMREDN
ncbi:hypothetical protein NC653_040559 [Populus alba x Populus x berolinensis]|uniref:Uncharacterized protein n=1 Tax=Populus alba x Populus x berolinensis TaxID=444605 RepID=A0AAD6L6E3_9ROSI|nr:hypothetical protein NC653_040559 [Populus alba x Populus x berolinensis]